MSKQYGVIRIQIVADRINGKIANCQFYAEGIGPIEIKEVLQAAIAKLENQISENTKIVNVNYT